MLITWSIDSVDCCFLKMEQPSLMFLESVRGVGGSNLPAWKLGISRYLYAWLRIRIQWDPLFLSEADPVLISLDPDLG